MKTKIIRVHIEDPILKIFEIKRLVRESGPDVSEDSDEFKAAIILLTAMIVTGSSVVPIMNITGYPRGIVTTVSQNFYKSDIFSWKGAKFVYPGSWADEKCPHDESSLSFWLDASCGAGIIIRTRNKGGEFIYEITEQGKSKVEELLR